jgi:MFS family permease
MSTDTPNTQSLSLIPPRLPGIIFTLALVAYIVAVTQRSSLGVAGVDAIDRFDASATALSTLAVMQVVVYAAAQIPVGMLLDRFGPSRLIITGAALMAIGQIIVAVAPSIEVAVVGRILVGLGDAATFVSGLRIISAWFRPRKVPVMQQWFGNLGQLGQFISAVPFSTLLHLSEWTVAFLTTASLSVIVVVAAIAGLKDVPGSRFGGRPMSLSGAFSTLGAAFGRPGTRLGFWSHFTTQFPGNVFGLLWGYPLMVQGLGYAPQLASALLIVPVVVGMFVGPVIGLLTARRFLVDPAAVAGPAAALVLRHRARRHRRRHHRLEHRLRLCPNLQPLLELRFGLRHRQRRWVHRQRNRVPDHRPRHRRGHRGSRADVGRLPCRDVDFPRADGARHRRAAPRAQQNAQPDGR